MPEFEGKKLSPGSDKSNHFESLSCHCLVKQTQASPFLCLRFTFASVLIYKMEITKLYKATVRIK